MSDDDRNANKQDIILKGWSNYRDWRMDREGHAMHKKYYRMLISKPYVRLPTAVDDQEIVEGVETITMKLAKTSLMTPIKASRSTGSTSGAYSSTSTEENDRNTDRQRQQQQQELDREIEEAEMNGRAIYFLSRSVERHIRSTISKYKTAKEMWEYLFSAYGRAEKSAIDGLLYQFTTLSMPSNASSAKVYAKVTDLAMRLSEAGHEISEEVQVRKVLEIMSHSSNLRMSQTIASIRVMMNNGSPQTLDSIQTQLTDLEVELHLMKQNSKGQSRALQAREDVPPGFATRGRGRGTSRGGSTSFGGQRGGGRGRGKSGGDKDDEQAGSSQKREFRCHRCKEPGHFKRDCTAPKGFRAHKAQQENEENEDAQADTYSFMAAHTTLDGNLLHPWLHDSGASSHMSSVKSDFTNLTPLSTSTKIRGHQSFGGTGDASR